jgi:hypothetical protein
MSRSLLGGASASKSLDELFTLAKGELEIDLKMVNSLNKECEIIQHEERTVLLYDQFLSKTFHELNYLLYAKEHLALARNFQPLNHSFLEFEVSTLLLYF